MRKAVIILVVISVIIGIFLLPIFTKSTHSVQFSIPPDEITIVRSSPEIESAEILAIQNFENLNFKTVIVQNTGLKMILYGQRSEHLGVITPTEIYSKEGVKWYKTSVASGYFQQIDEVKIYSPRQILFYITGNFSTTAFWSMMVLAIGIIAILILSLLSTAHKDKKTGLTT